MAGPADPFALGSGDDACLLLHGLTGSPAEVRPVGEALAAAGFRVVGPLLPGHGTTPEDLAVVTRDDLRQAARSALFSLAGARRIFLGGLSVGALLAMELAARSHLREGLPEISALALLAPAVEFAGATWLFTNVVGRLPVLPIVVSKGGRDIQEKPSDADQRDRVDGSYSAIPLTWGRELRLLRDEALSVVPRIRAPVVLLHGARDRTISPSGSRKLARMLEGSELHLFERSGHVLPLDVESAAVCATVVDFFRKQKVAADGQVRPRD